MWHDSDVAAKIPMDVISELLGVPRADRDRLRVLSDTMVHREEGTTEVSAEVMEASVELRDYFASWVADALAHFDDVWDVLTVENQARLVGAVVKRVVVDDVAGKVSAELVDLTEDVEDLLDEAAQAPDVAPGREKEARP